MEYKLTKVEIAPYDHGEYRDFALRLLKAAADRRQSLTLQDIIDAGHSAGRCGMAVTIELSTMIRDGLVRPVNGRGPMCGGTIICMVGEWPGTEVA